MPNDSSSAERPAPRRAHWILAASAVLSALGLLFLTNTTAIEPPALYMLAAIPVALAVLAAVTARSGNAGANASRRYLGRMALTMAFYLVTLTIAEYMIDDRGLTGWGAAILAALPGLAFAGVIWIFGGLIVEETDEFFRMLYIRQGLIATGFSLTLGAVWGYLETYRIVDHVAAFWWPTLWCFGIAIGAIANKVKYGVYGEVR